MVYTLSTPKMNTSRRYAFDDEAKKVSSTFYRPLVIQPTMRLPLLLLSLEIKSLSDWILADD